jgi:hypothetical protein
MSIQRRFEPDATVSDELVEALFQLLTDAQHDAPETTDSATTAEPATTCFLTPNE